MKKKHEKVKIKSNIVLPTVQRPNQYGFFWYFNIYDTWGKNQIVVTYLSKCNQEIPLEFYKNIKNAGQF